MDVRTAITDYSIRHYKLVTLIMVAVTVGLGALIPLIKVDTDPENMLADDEPVRVFHDQAKKTFDLSDMVVVGVVNETHPAGVFNPESLGRIYALTEFAKTLQWQDEKTGKTVGVIEVDMLAPSLVDHIGQGGPGVVTFEWLMPSPPETQAEADAVRDKLMSNPLLKGTMVSEDGQALCLYLPLTSKDLSYRVYKALQGKIEEFEGEDAFHITGLPVAEDTFGVEMFVQMAVSAPLAMLTIFILMLLFFRKLVLVISPMIVAMVSVITTMGLMIGLGYPVHIMSSMIPIFLMPIAVVDSVHILSEFFDLYTQEKGRKQTVREVMSNLFTPMLYTSLTSAAGFASLSLTPIPPVQVFGIFVAIGILIAWLCTVTFVPAYVMMIPEKALKNFGMAVHHEDAQSPLARLLHTGGDFVYRYAKLILVLFVIVTGVAIYGITRIQINDNPVKWFSKNHPIRRADTVLNKHFGGTYMAYLILEGRSADTVDQGYLEGVMSRFHGRIEELRADYPDIGRLADQAEQHLSELAKTVQGPEKLLDKEISWIQDQMEGAPDEEYYAWDELTMFFGVEKERLKVFKRPDVLRFVAELQAYLDKVPVVGKSNSIADIVKKVNQELRSGKPEDYVIPKELPGVSETLIQYQGSHRPQDLWHMVTPGYMQADVWVQLTSGDNRDMQKVTEAVDAFFETHTPPVPMNYRWAGLTYINVVWQDKMVWGMFQSFLGSFLVVFIMMAVLFRSPLWGLLCMVPLMVTIVLIYGLIGLLGKDYDMPVAVLSALTLGMAVDFAIHFLERSRDTYKVKGNWKESAGEMFGEPARAITRNVLVIAIGFLPLLAAPLVPYRTVGILLCAIMAVSGAVTLLILPALMRLLEGPLFVRLRSPLSLTCNCAFCVVVSAAAVVLVALNLHQYWQMGVTKLTIISVIVIPAAAGVCMLTARRKGCKTETENQLSDQGDKS